MTPARARIGAILAVSLAPIALAATAQAAPITAEQVLAQYNLVVLGTMQGGQDVEGRALVGGNLTGNSGTFFTRGSQAPASGAPALTVGGNVTGGAKNINSGGSVAIGGNLTTNLNMNGGGTATISGQVTGGANVNGGPRVSAPVAAPDLGATMKSLSGELSQLQATNAAGTAGGTASFNAATPGDTAVFSIANGATFFNGVNQISFVLGGTETVVVNVGGTSMTLADNWLGDGSSVADNVVWNFYEATSLTFNTAFYGTVLAPYATVRNANTLNGSIVVDTFNQGGAVRQYQFSGDLPSAVEAADVPEPTTLGLLAAGLAGMAIALRPRRRRPNPGK